MLGGMQTIMNHCVVDQQNPYLLQWSIVGLRMLTEKNQENQDFVRSLQSSGNFNKDDMKKLGIQDAKK